MSDNAIKVAVWGEGDRFPSLWPYFQRLEQQGILKVVAIASEQQGKIVFTLKRQMTSGGAINGIFLTATKDYWPTAEKLIKAGIPRDRIWDARVVQVNGMDWQRFLFDGTVQCRIDDKNQPRWSFSDLSLTLCKREYRSDSKVISLGCRSYIADGKIEGRGEIMLGNYSSVSWDVVFELGLNNGHDYHRIFTYDVFNIDWPVEEKDRYMSVGSINIGSDVWVARGCRLKASGSRPLRIGDGAVIAADSVVVSDVPPFAIVGGNPAKLIKWRFPEEIRRKLVELRWWDWPLEKLYHCHEELLDPLKFVQKHYQEPASED